MGGCEIPLTDPSAARLASNTPGGDDCAGDRTASAAASTVRDEELRPLVTPRRRRQPAWAASSPRAAAVTLVIGLAVSVLNGLFGTQRPAGPAHLPAAPRRFNPLIQNVSFGWLPAG
jgi:anti-sigma factor RsiW